jgi:YVTN family beta-propeller protein
VGTYPYAIGVNPTTGKIYVANFGSNTVSVIDGTSNLVVATVAVGIYPYAVGVNPTTNKVYVANLTSNTVSVINGTSNLVVATVAVGSTPCAVGVNPTTNKVYVANENSNSVSVIDGTSNLVVATVTVGNYPCPVGVNPTTNKIYVANAGGQSVSVIDGTSNLVVATVTVGTCPCAVGVNPTTNKVYVANAGGQSVSVIDGATNGVVATVTVGSHPINVGVNPTTDKVYVANWSSNSVSVIYYLTTTGLSPDHKTAGDPGDPAFTLTVNGTGFISGSVVRWNGSDRTTTYVSPTQITASVPAADIASAGTASVTVFNPGPGGGESNAQAFTVTLKAAPEPPVEPTKYHTWYLAEGSTAWGFSEYISIINPNPEAVTARVTYMTTTGPTSPPDVTLPASSQTTINPRDYLGNQDFSTKVECLDNETIAVDRTMTWTGTGAASEEAHNSVGVTSPNKVWYLPEGSSAWDFECWLLIQNPNDSEATCNVTYMVEGSGPNTVTKKVPAHSRRTYDMSKDIGHCDASIKVDSDLPVIPERAMYRHNRREGHDSIGTTAPAHDYYLAEGTTAWGFTTYVLIQNPQDTPTDVTITYMTPEGTKTMPAFQMQPNIRKTIRVNDELPNTDLSTQVHGSQPIIAERAMYWDKGLGEACHDSIGMDSPHTTFYLPDGETSNGRETWTLVQNPNSSSVAVEISYLTPSGAGNVVFTDNIPANSRKTYNMADKGINGRASVMVRCLTPGKKIMVERAMYWNSRGAGTDTIGGYGD